MSPPALEQAPMQNLVYSQKYQESHLWRSDCCKLSQQGNSCLFLRNSPTQFPLKKYASFPIVNNFVYSTLVYTSAATKQKLITHSGNGNEKKSCSAFILNVWNPLFPLLCPWHFQRGESNLPSYQDFSIFLSVRFGKQSNHQNMSVTVEKKSGLCLCLGSYTGSDDVNVLHVKLKLSVRAAQYWHKQSPRYNVISGWNQEVLVLTISWVSVKRKHTQSINLRVICAQNYLQSNF